MCACKQLHEISYMQTPSADDVEEIWAFSNQQCNLVSNFKMMLVMMLTVWDSVAGFICMIVGLRLCTG